MKKPSGSLIRYFSNLVKEKGGINLAQGISGFSPPPELLDILKDLIHDQYELHQYAPGNGNFKMLELISNCYSDSISLTPDNVIIVQGATEALSLLFIYLKNKLGGNYSVLFFDPPYESYPMLSRINNIPFECFDYCRDYSIDFDSLADKIREKKVKIVIVTSPGNPFGKIWTKEELEKLDILSRRYDFFILFDAVYKDIYFDRRPFNPLVLKNEKFIYINSFSKMLSITGWRIGYVIAETAIMKELREIHDYTGLCAPSLFQKAIADYILKYGFNSKYGSDLRKWCKKSFGILKDKLIQLGFTIPDIGGSYFIWAELPAEFRDGYKFALRLFNETKVAAVPGENFSVNKKEFLRFNFTFDTKIIKEAGQRISRFLL